MIQSRWNHDQEYLNCPCFAQTALNGLPSCLSVQPVLWCWGTERWESAGQLLLLKEGIPQAADRRLPVYVQGQKWRFVFSVSPQNKPSVTLREPSRRGHSGLSSAWHPAPLLPTGTGQGAVRLRVASQRSACQSSWLLACPAVAGLSLEQAEHNSLVLRALVPPKPGKNASCKASALSHCWRKALPDQQGL